MDVMTALQIVLKKALAHDGVARGLHEAVKTIEKGEAQIVLLAQDCDHSDYTKLVNALCSEHQVSLMEVQKSKQLGEWVGLCKIDAEGNARKVVGCSCAVIRDFGEETSALGIVKNHLQQSS